jgi:hypothetical protein
LQIISRLRWPLILTLVASGAMVAVRAAIGPYYLPVLGWVRTPLVAEGVCALAATLLLLIPASLLWGGPPGPRPMPSSAGWEQAVTSTGGSRGTRADQGVCPTAGLQHLAMVLVITGVVLAPTLPLPLVCDDYVLATAGRSMTWAGAAQVFRQPLLDRFFRPLADLSLVLDAAWSGSSPVGWHALGFALHLLNTALVYALAWRLFRRPALAFWAAAIFGIHGSRTEAVAYLYRFDQLATMFVLGGLILFDRFLETRRRLQLIASAATMLAGMLCKESAYVFPLLAIWLLVMRGKWRELRLSMGFFGLTALVFLYRWTVLGGIGGYVDRSSGRPEIFIIHPLLLLKGFTLRLWALFYFPINWTYLPEPWLAAALALAIVALTGIVILSRTSRRSLALIAAFPMIAALPVSHMLLIGSDLRSITHVYLPSAGFCIFLAAAIDGVRQKRAAIAAGAAVLLFQFAATAHNTIIWDRIAHLADDVCTMATREAVRSKWPPVFADPPRVLDGLPFFTDGLPECVGMRAPGATVWVALSPDLPDDDPDVAMFVWNEERRRFEPKAPSVRPEVPRTR